MAQQQQVPRDLAARIAEIDNAVERVRKTIAESNEALEPHESRRIEAFCDASVAAIGSSVDELRDNLVACYSLSYRPTVNLDDASHSHLRIDAAVNNLRDAIVGTEQLAAQLGLRAAGREIATIDRKSVV